MAKACLGWRTTIRDRKLKSCVRMLRREDSSASARFFEKKQNMIKSLEKESSSRTVPFIDVRKVPITTYIALETKIEKVIFRLDRVLGLEPAFFGLLEFRLIF